MSSSTSTRNNNSADGQAITTTANNNGENDDSSCNDEKNEEEQNGNNKKNNNNRLLNAIKIIRKRKGKIKKDANNKQQPKPSAKKIEGYEERRRLWMDRYGSLEALQSTFGTGYGYYDADDGKGGGRRNSTTHTETSSTGIVVLKTPSCFRGDLTPEQTRLLYHTLLPRSLLGLVEMNLMNPEEIAPLAYQARMAAKEYARSRCVWYARMVTIAFDKYRNVRNKVQQATAATVERNDDRSNNNNNKNRVTKATNNRKGSMTWEEIYSKYEAQIVREACDEEQKQQQQHQEQHKDQNNTDRNKKRRHNKRRYQEKDLTMRIYLRILEKSCVTNQAFDRMFLTATTTDDDVTSKDNNQDGGGGGGTIKNKDERKKWQQQKDLEEQFMRMGQQLDRDVREILLHPKDYKKLQKKTIEKEKKELKAQRKELAKRKKLTIKKQKQRQKRLLKVIRRARRKYSYNNDGDNYNDDDDDNNGDKRQNHRRNDQKIIINNDDNDDDGVCGNKKYNRNNYVANESVNETSSIPVQKSSSSSSKYRLLRIKACTRRKFRELLNE